MSKLSPSRGKGSATILVAASGILPDASKNAPPSLMEDSAQASHPFRQDAGRSGQDARAPLSRVMADHAEKIEVTFFHA
jgi:hypothetical protein